jgi:hypothetical protein
VRLFLLTASELPLGMEGILTGCGGEAVFVFRVVRMAAIDPEADIRSGSEWSPQYAGTCSLVGLTTLSTFRFGRLVLICVRPE